MTSSLTRIPAAMDADHLPSAARMLVICVAGSVEDRIQLSREVDERINVLLVSNAEAAARALRVIKAQNEPVGNAVVILPRLRLDSDRRVVAWSDHEVALTPLEHDLLACLLTEPGRMWTFEQIHEAVWCTPYLGSRSDMHSLVQRLRIKLTRLDKALDIEAIRGVGFRIALPATTTPLSR